MSVNVREVLPRDAIPSVDDPAFVAAHDNPNERVVGLTSGDEARAYPLRYLDFHEVVNDEIADRPVAVTWCPLCGSAIVYDATVDGQKLSFGVSGKLADDALVLYDRETESEWKQTSGVAIAGPLEGQQLDVVPSGVTTWGRFREANPTARVLVAPGGTSEAASDGDDPVPIDYATRPYQQYIKGTGFGLDAHRDNGGRTWDRDVLSPKAVVLGVTAGGNALGFPRSTVEDAGGVATATVGDQSVVVFTSRDGVHAFANPGYEFEPVQSEEAFRADGTAWDGQTGVSADGRRLERFPARRLFAFAWRDVHGDAFWTNDG